MTQMVMIICLFTRFHGWLLGIQDKLICCFCCYCFCFMVFMYVHSFLSREFRGPYIIFWFSGLHITTSYLNSRHTPINHSQSLPAVTLRSLTTELSDMKPTHKSLSSLSLTKACTPVSTYIQFFNLVVLREP